MGKFHKYIFVFIGLLLTGSCNKKYLPPLKESFCSKSRPNDFILYKPLVFQSKTDSIVKSPISGVVKEIKQMSHDKFSVKIFRASDSVSLTVFPFRRKEILVNLSDTINMYGIVGFAEKNKSNLYTIIVNICKRNSCNGVGPNRFKCEFKRKYDPGIIKM